MELVSLSVCRQLSISRGIEMTVIFSMIYFCSDILSNPNLFLLIEGTEHDFKISIPGSVSCMQCLVVMTLDGLWNCIFGIIG